MVIVSSCNLLSLIFGFDSTPCGKNEQYTQQQQNNSGLWLNLEWQPFQGNPTYRYELIRRSVGSPLFGWTSIYSADSHGKTYRHKINQSHAVLNSHLVANCSFQRWALHSRADFWKRHWHDPDVSMWACPVGTCQSKRVGKRPLAISNAQKLLKQIEKIERAGSIGIARANLIMLLGILCALKCRLADRVVLSICFVLSQIFCRQYTCKIMHVSKSRLIAEMLGMIEKGKGPHWLWW